MDLTGKTFSAPSMPELSEEEYDTRFDTAHMPENITQDLNMKSKYVDALWVSSADPISFHSHSFYEIVSCRNSVGVEYMIGSERYRVQKGDVLFIPPGVSHCPLFPDRSAEPFSRDMLWINKRTIHLLVENFSVTFPGNFLEPVFFRTGGTRWAFIADLFKICIQEFQNTASNHEIALALNAVSILVHLCRAQEDLHNLPMKAEKPELLDQVLSYIEDHLAQKITLADVSKAFFISESTITQTFRKKMGVSFYRCVTQRRLVAAKSLICSGVPLESVAEQVGFSDYSSFFRAFKQECGISPRQYRKLYNAALSE